MLDTRIETFLCVCRHMNFTKAAWELHLTQPAVSQHIHYLEAHYGTRLFAYENKKLRLTASGNYLRNVMEAMYHDTQRIQEAMQAEGALPRMRIGATMSIGEFYLPDKLSAFLQSAPDSRLSVTIADTRLLLSELDRGIVDFALIEGYFRKEDYAFRLLKHDDIVAVCAADYPLPRTDSIESLFACRLLLREKGSGTRDIFERELLERGYSLDSFANRSDFNSPHIIKRLLLAGIGISFLYRTVVADGLASGTLREIAIPHFHLSHEYSAVWKKNSLFAADYQATLDRLVGDG